MAGRNKEEYGLTPQNFPSEQNMSKSVSKSKDHSKKFKIFPVFFF